MRIQINGNAKLVTFSDTSFAVYSTTSQLKLWVLKKDEDPPNKVGGWVSGWVSG